MIPIKNLSGGVTQCPSQWTFQTFEDRWVYVRYRHGCLTISVGTSDHVVTAVDGVLIFEQMLSDNPYDGYIEWPNVLKILKNITKKEIDRKLRQRSLE
jgi:hypothetical protein